VEVRGGRLSEGHVKAERTEPELVG
jgi:hypothetical protein